jgi:cytochrome P450/NADPH-cytochrome P450 reductase
MATQQGLRPIPQPDQHFLTEHLMSVGATTPAQQLMEVARAYSPIFQMPGQERVTVCGYAPVPEVCDERRFDKAVTGGLLKLRDLVGDGLFTAWTSEPNWGKAHRILLPSFSLQAMQGFLPMMLDLAEQLLQKWERLNPEDEVDVPADMTRLTLDTIGLCGFDYRFNSFYRQDAHPFVQHMVCALTLAQETAFAGGSSGRQLDALKAAQFQEDADFMNGLMDHIIAERKQKMQTGPVKNDLLNAMLTGVDKQSGERLDDRNIRYQMITFLIAGHETTSGLLAFAIYFLLKHPDVLKRAYAEVDRVLGRDPRIAPTFQQVKQLTYLAQILKETLRLTPTAPGFTRCPHQDTVVDEQYLIKQDQPVFTFAPMLHRDHAVWGTQAEAFNPDHFSREAQAEQPPYAWLPFGAGQRACIGRDFAMQEAALVLGMILQRFELFDYSNYRLVIHQTLTIKPADFTIKVKPRPLETQPLPVTGQPRMEQPTEAAPQLTIPEHHTPLLVLYGSNMGTSEALAHRIADDGEAKGCVTTVAPLDDYAGRLPTKGAVCIVTASYNGTPPDNAVKFCAWLQGDGLQPNSLQGVNYAVFGCGNREWATTFQAIPRLIDSKLEQYGARRIYGRGEGDASADFADNFEDWYQLLWREAARALGIGVELPPPMPQQVLYQVEVVSEHTTHPLAATFDARLMEIVENRELHTKDGPCPSERSTRHLEVVLPAGVSYQAGDHLGVLPLNSKVLVNRVTERFSIDKDATIRLHTNARGTTILPLNTPLRVFDLLSEYVELQEVAARKQVGVLAEHDISPPEKARLLALSGEDEASRARYRDEVLAKRKSVLDLLEEFPSCALPFELYLSMLARLSPRYYSISSSPLVEAKECSITVGVVEAPARKGHDTFFGVCSTYLAEQVKGSAIFAFAKDTKSTFRLPADARTPIIMVGPGTGVAPFRGFLQERATLKAQGKAVGPSILFFGCRSPQQDFIYEGELRAFEQQGVTTLRHAFSRVSGQQKTYVQDSILANQEQVWRLLQQGAIVYICGEGSRMAPAVQQAFEGIYQEQTRQGQAASDQWMQTMQAQQRYLVDVWASS